MTTSESQSTDEPPQPFYANVARWAWLFAAVPLASAVVAVWLVAGGDMPVFLVLASNMNVPTLIAASVLLGGSSVITLVTVFCVSDWQFRERLFEWFGRHRSLRRLVGIFAIVISLTITWWIPLVYIGAVTLIVALELLSKRFWPFGYKVLGWVISRKGQVRPDTGASVVAVGVVAVIGVGPLVPWIPLEQVTFDDGEIIEGYVARMDSEWTTIVTLGHRIELRETDAIDARIVCNQGKHTSIANLLTRTVAAKEGFPSCEKRGVPVSPDSPPAPMPVPSMTSTKSSVPPTTPSSTPITP